MFRLVRLSVLLLIAFVAGIFFERGNQKDLCGASGGQWVRAGYCAGP